MQLATRTPSSWQLFSAALLALLLSSNIALANTYETGERLLRLHLPVHLEGDQTVRLDQLIHEHYDLDLSGYLLRGVVIESDGFRDRQHAYARLHVGRYKSARVFIEGGQTAIDAPAYRNSQWELKLGSGARVHGLLLVLEERRYSRYRTRPHSSSSLGLSWYLSSHAYRYPDYYYRDRYHYGAIANRYDRFYNPYHNRRHYRIQRRSEHYRRHRNAERNPPRHDSAQRPKHKPRHERKHDRNSARRKHDRNSAKRERSRSRPIPSQERQVERALRGNHEHARRPDRPRRQRVEPNRKPPQAAALAPRAQVQTRPKAQQRPRAQPQQKAQPPRRSSAMPRGSHRQQSPRLGRARSGLDTR